jgi:hypothetical protein
MTPDQVRKQKRTTRGPRKRSEKKSSIRTSFKKHVKKREGRKTSVSRFAVRKQKRTKGAQEREVGKSKVFEQVARSMSKKEREGKHQLVDLHKC